MFNENMLDKKSDENMLLVSNSDEIISEFESIVEQIGFVLLVENNGKSALELTARKQIVHIIIDDNLLATSSHELIESIRADKNNQYISIIILISVGNEGLVSCYKKSGCDDFLFEPFRAVSLHARIHSIKKIHELTQLYKSSVNEQFLANRVLNNALSERSIQFEEIGLLSKSKSVFSGDLFLTARHPDGSLNILLADFTGHGLSASIGALPVADIFSVMTEKGFDLQYILENINSKLNALLPSNMFMACCVLSVASDLKQVKIWNGGMPDIYIRSFLTGDVYRKVKSSHIPLGIDKIVFDLIELQVINLTIGDQLIMYTDGLTDAMNAENDMFGYENINQCLLQNKSEESIFFKLIDSFNSFCGDIKPMDDVTLACIPCTASLMAARPADARF